MSTKIIGSCLWPIGFSSWLFLALALLTKQSLCLSITFFHIIPIIIPILHSKFYKNCTGSVTLNTSRNFHCVFLQVSFSVAKFKAFFLLTKLQMAHVWTKKPCKSPLRGLKMFSNAPPWGRGESKLHFLRKQCKLTQIQQQQNAHSTCTMKKRHNMNNTLFETLPSFKISPLFI